MTRILFQLIPVHSPVHQRRHGPFLSCATRSITTYLETNAVILGLSIIPNTEYYQLYQRARKGEGHLSYLPPFLFPYPIYPAASAAIRAAPTTPEKSPSFVRTIFVWAAGWLRAIV